MKLVDIVSEDLNIISDEIKHKIMKRLSNKYNDKVNAALLRYLEMKFSKQHTTKNPLVVAADLHGVSPKALQSAVDDFRRLQKVTS